MPDDRVSDANYYAAASTMSGGFDRTDYSVVVKNRAHLPRPWRWEIYRAGRQSPIARSMRFFDLRSEAILEGKAALNRLLDELKF